MLLTTPLLRALRRRFPASRIDYCTGRWSAPALQNNPHLSGIITFDDEIIQQRQITELLRLAGNIRRRRYDVISVLDPGWQVHALARFFGGFQVCLQRNRQRLHDSQWYLALGKVLGCKSEDTTLEFIYSGSDEEFAENVLQKNVRPSTSLPPSPRLRRAGRVNVAICPGGGENPYQTLPEKRWPVERYRELVHQLESKGYAVVLLGGLNDKTIAQAVASPHTLNLAGHTTLGQAAAILAACDLAATHDSSLMHVAAAVGTPTLALFGPTDPHRLAPLGEAHRVIWKATHSCYHDGRLSRCTSAHNLRAISVAEVFAAVNSAAAI